MGNRQNRSVQDTDTALSSIKRYFLFLDKLKQSGLTVTCGEKVLVDNDVCYGVEFDKSFLADDFCDEKHFKRCKARCCSQIMKGRSLVFSGREYKNLPRERRSLLKPLDLEVNGKRFTFWHVYVKTRCPFLQRNSECEIHLCKPIMCKIPMIHFDLDRTGVVHVTKRLPRGRFRKSCILKLKRFNFKSDTGRLLVCRTNDVSTLVAMHDEFSQYGVETCLCFLIQTTALLYGMGANE